MKKMKPYPHKVDYNEVYREIKQVEINRSKYKMAMQVAEKSYFPRKYVDIARKYKITKGLVYYIKNFMENGKSN